MTWGELKEKIEHRVGVGDHTKIILGYGIEGTLKDVDINYNDYSPPAIILSFDTED